MFYYILISLVYLFFFFLSWTDVFSIANKIPLFIIFSSLIILGYFIKYRKINLKIYKIEDIIILILLNWILFCGIININEKTLNYLIVYVYVLLFMYLVMKNIFFHIPLEILLKANFYGVYFIVFFVIFEFVLYNFLGINIQDYLPRRRETTAIFANLFHRPYGFATEPGVIAYYFSTLGLISLWYVFYKTNYSMIKKILLTIIFIVGDLSLYSSTNVIAIILGMMIAVSINLKIKTKHILYILGLVFIFILLWNVLYSLTIDIFLPMYEKVTNMHANKSGSVRLERWSSALKIISNNPICGIGIGKLSAEGKASPISWYLFLMVESGVIAAFLLFLFYIFVFFKIQFSKVKGKIILLTSFIAGVIHLAVISTFQYPYLFIDIILIYIIIKQGNKYEKI